MLLMFQSVKNNRGCMQLRSISQEGTVMHVLELEDTDGLETAGKYIVVTTSITCTYITSIFHIYK